MGISRDTVIWGFRLILGREPESEAGIQAHLGLPDETALVTSLLRSPEFRSSGRFADIVSLREGATADGSSPWRHVSRSRLRVVLYGNCQVGGVARLLQAMSGDIAAEAFETTPTMLARLKSGDSDIEGVLRRADLVLVQHVGEVAQVIQQRHPRHTSKLRSFPPVAYAGFHPDCVYVLDGTRHLAGAMGEYHSSIAFWAWRQGLSLDQAIGLFRPEVFNAIGFEQYHETGYRSLLELGRATGIPLAESIDGWNLQGCWMHTINHPKIGPLADIAAAILRREGVEPIRDGAHWVEDPLARWPVWPVYPGLEFGRQLRGNFSFKIDHGFCPAKQPVLTMDLAGFVQASYATYNQAERGQLSCQRIDTPAYERLPQLVQKRPSVVRSLAQLASNLLPGRALEAPVELHPYVGLPDAQFWRRAVCGVPLGSLDPVVKPKFVISREARVATAGSCFAQHIARTLRTEGMNYFVADHDVNMSEQERERRGFGVFSARYGNLYTARQLVQLFDRAFGEFSPLDVAWTREDGRLVDPFRPQVEPDGHVDEAAVHAATQVHLEDVRRLFVHLDVFVFTLGLTEAWRRKADNAVFPLSPGVVAGRFDSSAYGFVNFSAKEVEGDLNGFAARLRSVNPNARMLLTVSPVPLIATYEPQHVLVSTTYSKSVLRAAAGATAAGHPSIDYFPSYEIVSGSPSRATYFESDLRSVTHAGVSHVMAVFMKHYAGAPALLPTSDPAQASALQAEQRQLSDLICDEEAIDRHRP